MSRQPFERISSTFVLLPAHNIDTDQIIPARYLKVTDRSGLGDALFADWRYDAAGNPRPDFPLNRPEARAARVLVAGHNFGCGSSREHAPWALLGHGFRAVISTGFADIFRSNSITNGLLPVVLNEAAHARLVSGPAGRIEIDLETQQVTLPDGTQEFFPIESFDKHCLLQGVDRLGFLLAMNEDVARFEAQLLRSVTTTQELTA